MKSNTTKKQNAIDCHLNRSVLVVEEGGYSASLDFPTACDAGAENLRYSRLRSPKSLSRLFGGFDEPKVFLLTAIFIKNKHTTKVVCLFLVEEGGFEPPKQVATDLQSAPFGHSGTLPYLIKKKVELAMGLEPATC